ncbi:MAG: cysteine synthase A [Erysipelotrichia bacterium]|nr:cysteine synthase A [Erysipelotrichia bacterium]
MTLYKNTLQLIGNTPLVELKNIQNKYHCCGNIYAKIEGLNPFGSVKDRVGLEMILQAEKDKLINKNTVIIEPTSGNTGIALAAIGKLKGYKVIIVMPNSMSQERRKILQMYGAELVLTEGSKGMQGSLDKVEELKKIYPNCFIPSQFSNPSNVNAHYNTTAVEIYTDLKGKVDYFISAIGTGGTFTGCGKYLKEKNKNIKCIAVEPQSSPLLSENKTGKHLIQGIGANFIPKILDKGLIDEIITVSDQDAYFFTKQLLECEALLCGISSGAALNAAVKVACRKESNNKNIVVILPDRGERYLSTENLF